MGLLTFLAFKAYFSYKQKSLSAEMSRCSPHLILFTISAASSMEDGATSQELEQRDTSPRKEKEKTNQMTKNYYCSTQHKTTHSVHAAVGSLLRLV